MKAFFQRVKNCFQANEKEIMRQNWQQLHLMTYIYLAVQILYYLAVCIPQKNAMQNHAVAIAIIAQIIYSVLVTLKKEPPRSMLLENICLMSFAAMIMALAIFLGTYVFRENIAWLFLIELIMLTQFYTMPPQLKVPELSAYLLIFIVGSFHCKSSDAAILDMIAGGSAFGVALTSYFSLTAYKIESFENKSELQHMCSVDAMTGLLNKTTFEYFYDVFQKSAAAQKPYALAILDIDEFKEVNDRHGHMAGDEALLAVSDCLRRIFPSDGFCEIGRFGGDEFVVLLKQTEQAAAAEKFQSLLTAVGQESLAKAGIPLTLSIGIAIAKRPLMPFGQLFTAADRALYEAKRQLGNSVCFAADSDLKERRQLITVDLDEAESAVVRQACQEYEILSAQGIAATMRLLQRHSQSLSLVLMSVHSEASRKSYFLNELKQIHEQDRIPVILIVSRNDSTAEWQSSADAILPSPFAAAELTAAIAGLQKPVGLPTAEHA